MNEYKPMMVSIEQEEAEKNLKKSGIEPVSISTGCGVKRIYTIIVFKSAADWNLYRTSYGGDIL